MNIHEDLGLEACLRRLEKTHFSGGIDDETLLILGAHRLTFDQARRLLALPNNKSTGEQALGRVREVFKYEETLEGQPVG